MADEYHKVGTTFRSSFHYPHPTTPDTYVTGKVQGDFTITVAKNGTTGQATTGITITEQTPPSGYYDVTVSGATGFVAATGAYELAIQDASDASERWVVTLRVTSDGTGAGSWGDASFTATASNGRVMSGGSPVSGATIRIIDPNSALYVQTTTGATGLWGPVYFNASGTYTVYVQRTGYTVATGTITVSGSSATGPGTDLTISAAASSTGLLASDLWAHFKRCIRDRSGAQADLLAQQGVDDALDMIAQEREWTWYETHGRVDLVAHYSTGSLTLTNNSAVVTLASGTWPSWAASGELYVGGQMYEILSRDSATQVTLVDEYPGSTASAVAYVVAQTEYDLPSDCMTISEILFDQSWPYGSTAVSMAALVAARSRLVYGMPRPGIWAVRRGLIAFWPYPTQAARINLLYFRKPARLTSAADEADWDPIHLHLLRRAIEYQASLRGDCVVGTTDQCMARYREALERAAGFEKSAADRSISVITTSEYDEIRRGTVIG